MSLDNGGFGDWKPLPECHICGKYAPNITLHRFTETSYITICDKCFDKALPNWRKEIKKLRSTVKQQEMK